MEKWLFSSSPFMARPLAFRDRKKALINLSISSDEMQRVFRAPVGASYGM